MRQHSPPRRQPAARTLLEPLEDRTLLSVATGSLDVVSTWPNGMPFQVSGWAFDADAGTNGNAPVTVRLDIDGFPVSSQLAQMSRPDIVSVVGSADHGYTFTVNPLAPGMHTLRVVAIDQPFGEARTLGSRNVTVQSGALGVIDSFDPANGVGGWAIDPALSTAPVSIQVDIDGHPAAFAPANLLRTDLVPFFGSGNHGFNIKIPMLATGAHQVAVFAFSLMGTPKLLGIFSASPPGQPIGHLDVANANIIGGWAVDPDNTTVGVKVRIDIDGTPFRTLTTDIVRPDLASFGTGPFGFQFNTPLLGAGTHTIQMFAIDDPTGTPFLIGTRTLNVGPRAPIGNVDLLVASSGATQIAGWTLDPDTPTLPVTFRIDVDKFPVSTGTANLNRPDVGAIYGSAAHGFNSTFGPLSAGSHIIDVFALDTQTQALTLLKSSTVMVTV